LDRNAFLAFALSLLILTLWMSWESKHRPKHPPSAPAAEQMAPGGASPERSAPAAAARGAPAEPGPAEEGPGQEVRLENPLVDAVLSSRGAGVVRWELRRYTAPSSEGGGPVVLLQSNSGDLASFATPFAELGGADLASAQFRVIEHGPRSARFESTQGGVTIRKTFTLDEDSYEFRLQLEVENHGAGPVSPDFTVVLPERVRSGSDFQNLTVAVLKQGTLDRAAVATFGKASPIGAILGREPERERHFEGDIDWAGAYSRYFVTALVPDAPRDAVARWFSTVPGRDATVEIARRPVAVLPGTALAREYTVYVGPKDPEQLAAAGAQLDRSIELGYRWVAPLTRAFTWMLGACYAVIPNYGVAIIVLTVLVRLATAPLATQQMKSMSKMRELQPRMKDIQERFRDDRQRQSQEMMKLYKETGVNPLGGCLPMLLQIPVFIGLYYALQTSIALRQAPFVLWINDLSVPETLFTLPGGLPLRLLPLLMCGSMVLQQRMTPSTMDPQQARMMMITMPVMFTFLFYTVPSGLVLYWFVSNLLAIAQQLIINRRLNAAAA